MKKIPGLVLGSLLFYGASTAQTPETLQSVFNRGNIINADNAFFLLNRSTENNYLGLQWQTGGTNDFFLGQRETGDRDFHLYNYGTGTTNVIVKRDNGYVGIGTITPAYKLDVSGAGKFGANAIIGTDIVQGFYQDASNGAYRSINSENNGFYFQNYAGETTSMFVGLNGTYAGKIGIGTVQPQSELAVRGTITSQRIKVTPTGWADYVFDSSYQLPPLHQVEKFIQENRHLSDVPTTAAVNKDGIDVGDNQALLLKKIEELTLYIIQQHKEIQELKKDVRELKVVR